MGTSYLKLHLPELMMKKKSFYLVLAIIPCRKKNAQKSKFLKQKLCIKTKARFSICCLSKEQHGGP